MIDPQEYIQKLEKCEDIDSERLYFLMEYIEEEEKERNYYIEELKRKREYDIEYLEECEIIFLDFLEKYSIKKIDVFLCCVQIVFHKLAYLDLLNNDLEILDLSED